MTFIQAENTQRSKTRIAIGARLRTALQQRAAMGQRERNLKHLRCLSDRQLQDIGISRRALEDW